MCVTEYVCVYIASVGDTLRVFVMYFSLFIGIYVYIVSMLAVMYIKYF